MSTDELQKPTLYHVPKTISSPIAHTLMILKLTPGTVRIKTINFDDLKTPQHLAINPMGTSPAFQDKSKKITMWESGAVLTYLLESYDNEHKFHPPIGSPDRAKFLHVQQYIIATVYPFIASLYIHTLKPNPDESYIETAKNKWRDLMKPVLEGWLGDQPYFLGDTMSAIDVLAAKPLSNLKSLNLLDESPCLKALFERVSSLDSYATAYGMVASPHVPEEFKQPKRRSIVCVPGDDEEN